MQASPMKLLKLLGDTKIVFKVPVYQRNYEWNKEQVEQYFLDIETIIKNGYRKNHFIGTIVFVTKEIENLMTERTLIDGQQRITTTILLLKAIVDMVEENGEDFITPDEVYETYLINKHASEQSKLKLKPVEADMKAYNELMDNNETNSKTYENYKLLKDMVTRSKYSLEEIYKAMTYLDIVYISLDKDENPQVIFESLNSTGLSLTQSDLIRNFILMGLSYDEQTELYRKYWVKIEEALPNAVISDFVRDYLTMKEGVVPNKSKVYTAFKIFYFKNNYNSEDILIELLRYSIYYNYIIDANTGLEDIDKQLRSINNIRSTVTYPYILDLFNDYYDREKLSRHEVVEILSIIVSYIYRRNICSIPTNALNKIFTVMPKETKRLRKEGKDYIDSVIEFLMSRSGSGIFPRDNEFKNNFITGNIYSKSHGIAKLILYSIEEFRHKEVVDMDSLSIEHILPQTLTAEWNIELGNKAYETHRLYKDTIGNLTLTNYNSEMSNKSFAEKKEYYINSNIITTREIVEFTNWKEEDIISRSNKLFDIVKNIWKLPEDTFQNIGEDRLLPNEEYSILDNVLVTGYSPKAISFDGERFNVKTWKEMLIQTSQYLFHLDEELFRSLLNKTNFGKLISVNEEILRSPNEIIDGIYIETNYSAKDILNYIVILTEELGISNLVYFEIN